MNSSVASCDLLQQRTDNKNHSSLDQQVFLSIVEAAMKRMRLHCARVVRLPEYRGLGAPELERLRMQPGEEPSRLHVALSQLLQLLVASGHAVAQQASAGAGQK